MPSPLRGYGIHTSHCGFSGFAAKELVLGSPDVFLSRSQGLCADVRDGAAAHAADQVEQAQSGLT
jgi:hypothetical protein